MRKTFIIFAAIVLIFIIYNMTKFTGPQVPGVLSLSAFKDKAYRWLSNKEGGLSNGTLAGDSKLKRAPCQIRKNGIIMDPPPHTNRGVTYNLFVELSSELGYEPSCANFAAMPEDIWRKIVDWHTKQALSYTKDTVLAFYIGLWIWGGWRHSLVSPAEVRTIVNSNTTQRAKLRKLVNLRKEYFAKTGYGSNIVRGWQNRAEDFYKNFYLFTA